MTDLPVHAPRTSPRSSSPAVVAALVIGAVAGAVGATLATHDTMPVASAAAVQVPRDYSAAELQLACLPYMRETATTLDEVQTKVSALEVRVREKEAEIARLEIEMHGVADASDDAGRRLDEARGQLTTLVDQLGVAQAEREQLLRDLQEARADLSEYEIQVARQKAELVEAHEGRLDDRWRNFVQDAQLDICAVGTAFAVETCRAEVQARLMPLKLRYKDCVRSAQAEPEIRRALRRDEVLPDVAVWLDVSDRSLTNWYVLFCDPELPERGQRASGGGGLASPKVVD